MRAETFKPLVALLAVLVALYAFGSGGIFFFDDAPSMDGMLAVQDRMGALAYIFSGDAGPLGRPVALATFLLQRGAYAAGNADAFLWVNIGIHLLNVALLGWLVFRLQRQWPQHLGRSEWLAPAVAFFWGVLPILASASLMIVQRMTTLSALFALLGMHAYLWARDNAAWGRWPGMLAALVCLGLCTLLSALSKENGVLLPLLLLVLHSVLLRAPTRGAAGGALPADGNRRLGWVLGLALWLPSLAVLGYVASRLPTMAGTYWLRPFTLSERLASEAVILWEYLRVAFLPRLADLSPFHDDYPVRHFSDGVVQLALAAWAAVLVAAAVLWRRGQPLLLFAVLWYLAGHLLESSVFALFLYFEHRNYVPLIGPVLALAAWFAQWSAVPGRIRGLMAGVYGVFLAFMLWQTTSMWGSRQQLVWARAHPDSPRALQMLAGAYMQAGKVKDVDTMYEGAIRRNPRLTSVAMQGLRASCYLNDEGQATRRWLGHARQSLPTGVHSHLTVSSLSAVAQLQMQGRCVGLAPADVLALAGLMQGNPVFRGVDDRQGLSAIRANVLLSTGDVSGAMAELRQALKVQPDMDTIQALYGLIMSTQGHAAADAFLQEARAIQPTGSAYARQQWQHKLDVLGKP
ncbi:tetratricopeptide repeat protein [Ottowia beijingensis]